MAITAEKYRGPHVTEVNEARWDDCRPCSALMLVAAWTLGSVVTNPSGSHYSQKQLKRLRENMRNKLGPADQLGPLNSGDTRDMIARQWPWLPPVRQPNITWSEFTSRLGQGHAFSLSGNPSDVKLPASKLRKWTYNDDFGHEIFVRAISKDGSNILIYDPLAPTIVNGSVYRGNWVPTNQVRQFAYINDGIIVACSQVRVGSQSEEQRMKQKKNKTITSITTGFQDKIGDLMEERNALALSLAECESQVPEDCSAELRRGWDNAIAEIDAQLREMENTDVQ